MRPGLECALREGSRTGRKLRKSPLAGPLLITCAGEYTAGAYPVNLGPRCVAGVRTEVQNPVTTSARVPAGPPAARRGAPAFYVGGGRLPAGVEPVDFATLLPVQRLLLVIDGTVTTALEALAGEAIAVTAIDQQAQSLAAADADLAAPAGATVLARRVALTGEASGRRYALAASVILPDRLPEALRAALAAGRVGIGQVLRTPGFDSRREGLWFGRFRGPLATAAGPAGSDFLARAYRVLGGGVPVMRITEYFPWDLRLP